MADDTETAAVSGVEQTAMGSTDSPSLTASDALTGTCKHAIGELRQLLYCKVCIRPMYEPYTVACGHTFCYSCLSQWFESHRSNKTCPECRTPVWRQPAPAYALREIVQLFLKTREFLSEEDDIQDHERARQEEASQVEKDRSERKVFGSSFGISPGPPQPSYAGGLVDYQDGVRRCPQCFWELERGYCNNCDTNVDLDYDSDTDYAHPFHTSPSGRPIPVNVHLHGIEDWSVHSSDSEYESEDFGEMDDFIEDDLNGRHGNDDPPSDVDSLELTRQRLNSAGSAYSAGSARSARSPRTSNQPRPRLRRGTSEPTGSLRSRRQVGESSSDESSSESETASTDTEGRQWPLSSRDQTPHRVNFAPDPVSSDEAEEITTTAALPARPARKRRRVVADDSDEDAPNPMPESSITPTRRRRAPISSHLEPDSDEESERSRRDISPANSDGWETDGSHAPDCALHPNNRLRARMSNRSAPPVALSRFSRRGRRQVADE